MTTYYPDQQMGNCKKMCTGRQKKKEKERKQKTESQPCVHWTKGKRSISLDTKRFPFCQQRGSGVRFFVPKSVEALQIFYMSFSSSEIFRSTELMSLPSLPRLRSQTRHIPRAMPFYFENLYRNQNFPWKIDVSRTKFVREKSFCTR